jgi:hypothetical protein
MTNEVELRAVITEFQSERLQERLKNAGIDAQYREEQHGATLVAHIKCGRSQEKTIRQILQDIGTEGSGD